MNWKRLLCFVGIHWEGQTGLGMMGDAGRCDICGADYYGLKVVHETPQRAGPPTTEPDLWAKWPDHFMCPVAEIDEYMRPPCARSDDFYIVEVIGYDIDGTPETWRRITK